MWCQKIVYMEVTLLHPCNCNCQSHVSHRVSTHRRTSRHLRSCTFLKICYGDISFPFYCDEHTFPVHLVLVPLTSVSITLGRVRCRKEREMQKDINHWSKS